MRERAAVEVVVGLPRSLSGGEGPAAQAARAYAERLAALVAPVPVRLVDERLTTVTAHQALRRSGVRERKGRQVVDQVAAVVILQQALDIERSSGRPPGEPVAPGRARCGGPGCRADGPARVSAAPAPPPGVPRRAVVLGRGGDPGPGRLHEQRRPRARRRPARPRRSRPLRQRPRRPHRRTGRRSRPASTDRCSGPGDGGFPAAHRLYDPRWDAVTPAAVVRAAGPADVVESVQFAAAHGVQIDARGGGHSYLGASSVAGGLVVDTRALRSVAYDAGSGIATIGAGAALVDVYTALAGHGRSVAGGTCPSVGLAGLAQGGGFGVFDRTHGLTCDAIVGFDVVTADGRRRTVDGQHEPDLYWALRGGGGGDFAIVTSLRTKTFATSAIGRWSARWPWSRAAAVVAGWQALMTGASDQVWANLHLDVQADGSRRGGRHRLRVRRPEPVGRPRRAGPTGRHRSGQLQRRRARAPGDGAVVGRTSGPGVVRGRQLGAARLALGSRRGPARRRRRRREPLAGGAARDLRPARRLGRLRTGRVDGLPLAAGAVHGAVVRQAAAPTGDRRRRGPALGRQVAQGRQVRHAGQLPELPQC